MSIYKQWEMTSVLLHSATNFKLTISSSFRSQITLFWELFTWEKICNLGGTIGKNEEITLLPSPSALQTTA